MDVSAFRLMWLMPSLKGLVGNALYNRALHNKRLAVQRPAQGRLLAGAPVHKRGGDHSFIFSEKPLAPISFQVDALIAVGPEIGLLYDLHVDEVDREPVDDERAHLLHQVERKRAAPVAHHM